MTPPVTFGQLLRDGRNRKGISLRAAAAICGINAPNLCALEKNRRPVSAETIMRVMGIVSGVSRDELCAAANILPPDIELTLACNPVLWPKVRGLYS